MTAQYRIGPAERKRLLMGLRTPQVVIMGTSFGLSVFAFSIGGIFAMAAIVIIGAILSFAPISGRQADEWLPVILGWVMKGSGGRAHTSMAPLLGHSDVKNQTISPPPMLSTLKMLKVSIAGGSDIAVIKDVRDGTYTAVLELQGSSFALTDTEEQEASLAAWGNVLATFTQEGSNISRLQWIERSLPEDDAALRRYFEESHKLDLNDTITQSYTELIDQAVPVTSSHEVYLAVQVSQAKLGRALRTAGGDDGAACELLIRELKNIEQHLDGAGITTVRTLGREEIAYLFRTTFEPFNVQKISERSNEKKLPVNEMWPVATHAEWSYYQTDNSFHATFWIAEFSRTEVESDFMAPLLLQSSASRIVSVVMEPIAPGRAIREVEVARTSYVADSELRGRAGYMQNASRDREFETLLQREQELVDGHGAYRFSAYITVTAPDLEKLDAAISETEHAAHQSHLLPRRLYGEQDVAFATALPLARGLA